MLPTTIPTTVEDNTQTFEVSPSFTYSLDFTTGRIIGKVDGANAVFQAVQKILNTERYAYEIYNWYYGMELIKLVGKDYAYITIELPRLITEALKQDDRIQSVENFVFHKLTSDSMSASCTVNTVFGNFPYSLEVLI